MSKLNQAAPAPKPDQLAVQQLYDQDPEREWQRLDRHRTEFALTLRALAEHLPPPPARLLDCGGGPGRYAVELAQQGYQVTLFDLSSGNLALARRKALEAGVTLAAYEQGSATDLSRFTDDSFDAVLMLGPLYHLLDAPDREQALREARRVLNPGGPLAAAFISRYAGHRWAAANEPTWLVDDPEAAQGLLASGRLPVRAQRPGGFVGYFAHPREVRPLFRQAGLEIRAVLGVEGLVSMIEEPINALTGTAWDAWVDLNWRVAADPSIFGCVEHLLVIAYRPAWRPALRLVAQCLNQAGVAYRVAGGAVIALHGVPEAVKDVDIETDAQGANRIQSLLAEYVDRPISPRDDGMVRSHFGGLLVHGVAFDIIGDMERREAQGWQPTHCLTEAVVDLEGVAVRTCWLEEQLLVDLRRGRLERAARYLPLCDRDRLLALLRGQVDTVERLQRVMSAKASDSEALLVPPRRDVEALARAQALADAVRAELEGLEASLQFDEFMQQQRGRTWSP